jgi:hypothetical protein
VNKSWQNGGRDEEGVRELNKYNEFARANLPSNVPFLDTEDALEITSKLICFEEVDVSKLKLPEKKTKEEKGCTSTAQIS